METKQKNHSYHLAKQTKVKSDVIRKPRITEKATQVAENNVYTFNVDKRASKTQIKEAVKKLYNITPVKVHISVIKQKYIFKRGRLGKEAGGKKALVYLKKGDTIKLM
jgi:large subunit ribosomal protein L23